MIETVSIPVGHPPIGRESGMFLSRGRGQHLLRTRDDWELIVVRRGLLPIAENGIDKSIQANQWLILPPGRQHGGTASYAPDLEFHWLHFSAHGSTHEISVPTQGSITESTQIEELLLRYEGNDLHPLAQSGLILEILAELISPQPHNHNALAQRADQVIARCFHEPISTVDVAKKLGVHPDHLGRRYRASRGHSVLQEIQKRRIADAKALLISGNASQSEIATECGFSDVRYFRRVFRELVGTSPGTWRDRRRGGELNSR